MALPWLSAIGISAKPRGFVLNSEPGFLYNVRWLFGVALRLKAEKMGLTKVTTKISAFSDSGRFYEAVFLVDTDPANKTLKRLPAIPLK